MAKSTVKSANRQTNATRLAAELPRDPVTHRFLPRKPADPAPADPAPTPPSPPAGGDAQAPNPFRGRVVGRRRRRSES